MLVWSDVYSFSNRLLVYHSEKEDDCLFYVIVATVEIYIQYLNMSLREIWVLSSPNTTYCIILFAHFSAKKYYLPMHRIEIDASFFNDYCIEQMIRFDASNRIEGSMQ